MINDDNFKTMNKDKIKRTTLALLASGAIVAGAASYQCSGSKKTAGEESVEVITSNQGGTGQRISVAFSKGKAHNHPLMAIWTEDMSGNYIETLFVAESIGKGVFRHGERSLGHWMPGPVRRPAALPYWGHKRGVIAPDGYYIPTPQDPMPDAVTGPTPTGSFLLNTRAAVPYAEKFFVLLEINQSWDWNDYWTNNKFPGDEQYKTSSQPAIVYRAEIDLTGGGNRFAMKPVGHSHYSGADGMLYEDLGTLTTALEITEGIMVTVTND